jgi:hypothetical protein
MSHSRTRGETPLDRPIPTDPASHERPAKPAKLGAKLLLRVKVHEPHYLSSRASPGSWFLNSLAQRTGKRENHKKGTRTLRIQNSSGEVEMTVTTGVPLKCTSGQVYFSPASGVSSIRKDPEFHR